jgi:hypothetical protein
MRRSIALAGAAALLITASLASSANAADPAKTKAHHDRVLAYWTAERIKSAKPLDKHLDKSTSGSRAPEPLGKPVRNGGGSVASTTGKQWPNGVGKIYKATGRVLFTMNGGNWICSGSVVNDALSTASLVLSAGHCAFDQANHAFVTNWIFIPEFDSHPSLWDCTTTTHGCWVADSLNVSAGFANEAGFNTAAAQYDWSFAVVHAGGFTGGQLDATVGSFPIAFTSYSSGTQTAGFGYPAAGKYAPGNELVYCAGSLGTDPYNLGRTYRLGCDMTGGSSGGPWLTGFRSDGNSGTLSSVNSYTYSGITAMHGPKFNSRTQAAYTAATTATGNNIVP